MSADSRTPRKPFRRCPDCRQGVSFLWLEPLWWVCRMCKTRVPDEVVSRGF